MNLVEWAKLSGESLFEMECWTVAKVLCPVELSVAGYILFTNPLPYHVLAFRTVEHLSSYFNRAPEQLVGRVYHATDWAREQIAG